MSLKEYRRRQMQSALEAIVFTNHIEVEGVLLVLELMQYRHFSILLGIANELSKVKGMQQLMNDYRCQEQLEIILNILGRSGPIDKFFSIFTKKNERDIRREFVQSIIEKMNDRLDEDRSLFENGIFDAYLNEVDCLSGALRLKKNQINRAADLYNIENKAKVVKFLKKNYGELRRTCKIPGKGYDILDARDRFLELDQKINNNEFQEIEGEILDSKFVDDGITFFISSDFYSGFVVTTYSFIAAGVMAFIFATLSLTGTTLAVATVVCTAIFLIFIPMLMTSSIKTFVDWAYDKVKETQEYKLSTENGTWKHYLIGKGIFHDADEEKANDSSFDSRLDDFDDDNVTSSTPST